MSRFTLIKLDAKCQPMPADATDHALVRNATLGFDATIRAPGFDKALTDADANKAVAKLNADLYLGYSDWRRPEPWEQLTQIEYINEDVMADLSLYPDMKADWYWTSEPMPWSSGCVFCVSFYYGSVDDLARGDKAFVRPVRSVSPGQ